VNATQSDSDNDYAIRDKHFSRATQLNTQYRITYCNYGCKSNSVLCS